MIVTTVFSLVLILSAAAAVAAGSGALFVGSGADISAIKSAERTTYGGYVYAVHVAGGYAILKWLGNPEGHGYVGYHRVSGEVWQQIANGGGEGELGNKGNGAKSRLLHAGVPAAIVAKLCANWPSDANPCPDY